MSTPQGVPANAMRMKLHQIQLQVIAVRELFIRTYRALPPSFVIPPEEVRIESACGEYNKEKKIVQIDVRAYFGQQEGP